MANATLPSYLASAKPNPTANRGPWYANIAPSYFGIFMWIAFYNSLGGSLKYGGLGMALLGLVAAGLISHFLFYYVFGVLGMKTGLPLYIVGSSTFGTKGGYLFPGIFMGLLQIGWYSVGTYFATDLVLRALGQTPVTLFGPGPEQKLSGLFIVVAIAWGYIFATFGAFGIKYVAKISTYLPWIALAMLVIAAVSGAKYIGSMPAPTTTTAIGGLAAAALVIQMVIGFFATAGAAGVDFGTAARNADDVNKGGLTGIALAIIVAGGLAIVTVAGAQGSYAQKHALPAASATTVPATTQDVIAAVETAAPVEPPPAMELAASLPVVSPNLAKIMFIFFAIGSMAPACFCSSIIGNSLSTMIPSLPRVPLTLAGASIGIVLAATGLAGNLVPFFGFIGASFGPICGAMVADYLLSGRKWAGPREGVSIAGYAAWIIGFIVGVSNNSLLVDNVLGGKEILAGWHPTAVYSFIVGFVVYYVLAAAGLQGKPVPYAHTAQQQ